MGMGLGRIAASRDDRRESETIGTLREEMPQQDAFDFGFGHACANFGKRRFKSRFRELYGMTEKSQLLLRLAQADRRNLGMDIGEGCAGQRLLQCEEIEDAHALAFDTDTRTVPQLRQRRASRQEGADVTVFISPIKDRTWKSQGRERTHFEVGHYGHRIALAWHDDREGTLHLMEIVFEDTAEIGARYQHQGVETGAFQDVEKGIEIRHAVALPSAIP
jgi:hypothetical protein